MHLRIFTIITGLGLSLLLLPAVGYSQTANNINAIPLDDAGLSKLDQKHLRLARKAGTVCVHLAPGGVVRRGSAPVPLDGCTISQMDQLVSEQNDPALTAYHNAIRPGERYDQNRSSLYWRTVRTQLLANHPELKAPAAK